MMRFGKFQARVWDHNVGNGVEINAQLPQGSPIWAKADDLPAVGKGVHVQAAKRRPSAKPGIPHTLTVACVCMLPGGISSSRSGFGLPGSTTEACCINCDIAAQVVEIELGTRCCRWGGPELLPPAQDAYMTLAISS